MDLLLKTRQNAAELVLILATTISMMGEGRFNLYLLGTLAVLIILWYSQNKLLGLIVASVLAITAIWMSGAVIAEYSEFPSRTSRQSLELLISGITLFGTLGFLSLLMFRKYNPLKD